MARVVLIGNLAQLTGGVAEFQLSATSVKQLFQQLAELHPALGPHLEEGVAVAIDGQIYQDTLFEPIGPDSEVFVLPQIAGGVDHPSPCPLPLRGEGEMEASMPRMEPLGIHEVDDQIRHMCEESERQIGTSASTRTYARNPMVVKALAAFRGTLTREGTIDPVVLELVRIKFAGLNACRY
jgi:molybdopterin synthase sulfur carrier subunit